MTDTLEQRIARVLKIDCDHTRVAPCWMCKQWAEKKSPDIARALEAALECTDELYSGELTAYDAFCRALSEDKND